MEKLVSDMGRRAFDGMRSPRAATMTALASTTGHARTLPASRTGAGETMPCSMHFLMLSVLRGFAVRLRPRHAATSPGWEECPEQAYLGHCPNVTFGPEQGAQPGASMAESLR